LFLVFLLSACRPPPTPHRDPEAEFGQLDTVAFAGDVVLARRMNGFVEEHGPGRPLRGVRDLLADADIAAVNLECIIASGGEPADKDERNPYFFRGRPELVRVLTEAGVDVASLGNNHAGDYGPDAVIEGVRILREAGVDPVGGGRNLEEAMAPVFRKVGDTVVAFIAMDMTQRKVGATETRAGPHFVDENNPTAVVKRVRDQVRLARRYAHLVFFMTHWGPNGAEEPGEPHRDLARRLVREAGIDALLGSSAHQLHGMEVIDGRPVIYDAGNLIFDYNDQAWTHKTAIFTLHFDQVGVRWVEAHPVRMGYSVANPANDEEHQEIVMRLDDLSRRLGTRLWIDSGRALLGVWNTRPREAPREAYQPPARAEPVLPTLTSSMPPRVTVKAVPETARPLNVRFEGGYELLGVEMPRKIGHRVGVPITTYWRVQQPPAESLWIFLHGEAVPRGPGWRGDHEPADWAYPTTRWTPGEIVRDFQQLRPPGDSAHGAHEIYVGLFKAPEGRRLAVLDAAQHDGENRVMVGVLEVE
jgi:poly-gamma-glutamate capsule biosynthesis protein CapA/YwtB (metallophosphatase superfamily)